MNCNKALENVSLRVGAAHKSEHCHSDNRIRVDFASDNKHNVTLYNRTVVTKCNYTFGMMAAYALTSNVLVKNNLTFNYLVKDQGNISLRAENRGFRKEAFNWANWKGYFDQFKVDFVTNFKNNFRYGVEVNHHLFREFLPKRMELILLMKLCL